MFGKIQQALCSIEDTLPQRGSESVLCIHISQVPRAVPGTELVLSIYLLYNLTPALAVAYWPFISLNVILFYLECSSPFLADFISACTSLLYLGITSSSIFLSLIEYFMVQVLPECPSYIRLSNIIMYLCV